MRLLIAALFVLTSACSTTQSSSRRPLSSCAKQLVDERYLPESETAKAADYCSSLSADQLACAKREYAAHRASDVPFGVSKACAGTASPSAPVVAVVAPAPVVAPISEPAMAVTEPDLEQPLVSAEAPPALNGADILMVAAADENLSTFVRLLNVAGLTKTIQGAAAVTLLAPNNEALAKMPHLADNKQRLRKVLSGHVVLENVSTIDSPEAPAPPRRLKTLGGKPVPMRTGRDGVVNVGRAKIVRADMAATQGNVDVIDAVLLP